MLRSLCGRTQAKNKINPPCCGCTLLYKDADARTSVPTRYTKSPCAGCWCCAWGLGMCHLLVVNRVLYQRLLFHGSSSSSESSKRLLPFERRVVPSLPLLVVSPLLPAVPVSWPPDPASSILLSMVITVACGLIYFFFICVFVFLGFETRGCVNEPRSSFRS